jgi:hypothetical protein
MKTNRICTGFLLAGCFVGTAAYSQEEAVLVAMQSTVTPGSSELVEEEKQVTTFTLSGTIDTYFHSSLGITNPYYGGMGAPTTAFADLPGFGLGMVNLIATYSGEKAGFTADLVLGPRGKAAVFGSPQGIINQMYAYYKLTDKVTLNLGQFNTFVGYEVISPAVNFHYSTSYMFSWGPFSHSGLRADFDLGGGMIAKLAIMNPTDLVEFNPVNTYTLGAQIGHANDAGGIWLNFLYGDQDGTLKAGDDPYVRNEDGTPIGFISSDGSLFQADVTAGWNLTEKFYLGLNTSYQTLAAGEGFIAEGDIQESDNKASSFMGFALYPKISLSESFALGLRAEYLNIANGHLGIFGLDADGQGGVMEFTLSGNYKVGGLTFIPEVRVDKTTENSFVDADGNGTDMMPSLNLAAVYKF